jgi:hypothetical protein
VPTPSGSLCKSCQSDRKRAFSGEIAIHFPGIAGLDKPVVWVFTQLQVCSNCGFAEFTVPEAELSVLEHGAPVKGALVWDITKGRKAR